MDIAFFTIIYFLLAFCLIAPPVEFRRVGLTVECTFSHYLGSENIDFVHYHIRRTTANFLVHSFIPLSYYILILIFHFLWPTSHDFNPWINGGFYWDLYFYITSSLALLTVTITYYWWSNNWHKHPIVNNLSQFNQHWKLVASSVNNEFRRIEKFMAGDVGCRIYVTDSWILKTSTYTLSIAHKHDAKLSLIGSATYPISIDSPITLQMIQIEVKSVERGKCNFVIHLNSEKYQELTTLLEEPVENVRNIIVHQSINDKFVLAFKEQIMKNECYIIPAEAAAQEQCIGCLVKPADIKLQKLCAAPEDGNCQGCYCKPMWCLECLGKWFACRQDQRHTEGWLSSKAPCPTCRAVFCVLDVCLIERA